MAELAEAGDEKGISEKSSNPINRLDWDALAKCVVSDEFCDRIRSEGFAVIDTDVFAPMGRVVKQEMMDLWQETPQSGFTPHTFQFGEEKYGKPHIFEADMHNEALQSDPRIPNFHQLFYATPFARRFAEALPELDLDTGINGQTVKLQFNEGQGGCFPLHYDNPGPPNKRILTCVLYLNENWQPGDGGEIELQPFLSNPVVVPPVMGRFVCFRSDSVLHRVLPSVAPRYCFTIWIDGHSVNSSDTVNLKAKHLSPQLSDEEKISFFRSSPVQRALSRAVYETEYAVSLRNCMEDPEGVDQPGLEAAKLLLRAHAGAVAKLNAIPALTQILDLFRRVAEENSKPIVLSHTLSAFEES